MYCLWAGSLFAQNPKGAAHTVGWAQAENRESAHRQLLTQALRLFPPEAGWTGHNVILTFIPHAPGLTVSHEPREGDYDKIFMGGQP